MLSLMSLQNTKASHTRGAWSVVLPFDLGIIEDWIIMLSSWLCLTLLNPSFSLQVLAESNVRMEWQARNPFHVALVFFSVWGPHTRTRHRAVHGRSVDRAESSCFGRSLRMQLRPKHDWWCCSCDYGSDLLVKSQPLNKTQNPMAWNDMLNKQTNKWLNNWGQQRFLIRNQRNQIHWNNIFKTISSQSILQE